MASMYGMYLYTVFTYGHNLILKLCLYYNKIIQKAK